MLLRDGSTIQLPTLRLFGTSFPEPGIAQGSIYGLRRPASRKFHCDITALSLLSCIHALKEFLGNSIADASCILGRGTIWTLKPHNNARRTASVW